MQTEPSKQEKQVYRTPVLQFMGTIAEVVQTSNFAPPQDDPLGTQSDPPLS